MSTHLSPSWDADLDVREQESLAETEALIADTGNRASDTAPHIPGTPARACLPWLW